MCQAPLCPSAACAPSLVPTPTPQHLRGAAGVTSLTATHWITPGSTSPRSHRRANPPWDVLWDLGKRSPHPKAVASSAHTGPTAEPLRARGGSSITAPSQAHPSPGPRTTPRSQMMFMRSCTPLTPWGILVKSSLPMAFCLVLKGRWSEATMFSVSLREDGAALLTAPPGRLGHSQRGAGCSGSSAPREWGAQGMGHPWSGGNRERGAQGMWHQHSAGNRVPRECGIHAVACPGSSAPSSPGAQ